MGKSTKHGHVQVRKLLVYQRLLHFWHSTNDTSESWANSPSLIHLWPGDCAGRRGTSLGWHVIARGTCAVAPSSEVIMCLILFIMLFRCLDPPSSHKNGVLLIFKCFSPGKCIYAERERERERQRERERERETEIARKWESDIDG